MSSNNGTLENVPQSVSDLDIAFPAGVSHLMPAYSDIPDEFKSGHSIWNDFFNDWFFSGLKDLKITPCDNIDKSAALRHLAVICGSFEPKHEHKEAAVAYLASLWFKDASYKRAQ